jgi:purine-binding chemotaxis protein CheW
MNNLQKTETGKIVLFSLEEPRYALYLSAVERVIRSVEITPLPKAPEIVLGVINLQGEIIPVIDIRRLFHLPAREIDLEDQFITARTSKRLLVLSVDSVEGVLKLLIIRLQMQRRLYLLLIICQVLQYLKTTLF